MAWDMKRNNYFAGRLMTAADFEIDQTYFRQRVRLLSRALLRTGVVSGLGVSVASHGSEITVGPGLAVAPNGDLIEVCAPLLAVLPPSGRTLHVALTIEEQSIDPIPGADAENPEPRYAHLQETAAVKLSPHSDDPSAVAIARLKLKGRKWRKDRNFKPLRAR